MLLDRSDQLSDDLLAQLSRRGRLRELDKGETLFLEGQASDALYILLSGELKVFTGNEKGRELVYNLLKPGEFIGELLLDGGARSASVKAIKPSTCIALSPAEFLRLLRNEPEFVECLVLKLIGRVRHATAQLRSLAMKDVYERTTSLIEQLAVFEGDVRVLDKGVTQQEIADRVGASREMINQIFRELERGGFLARDGRRRLLIVKPLPSHW